jgi:hypothetical protein
VTASLVLALVLAAQAWVTDRARVLKPSTLRLVVSLARSVFTAAALDRLIGTSPFARVTLSRCSEASCGACIVGGIHSGRNSSLRRDKPLVISPATVC